MGLDVRETMVRFPKEIIEFSLTHTVSTVSGTHPFTYAISSEGTFLQGISAEAWTWPLTPI